MITKSQFASKLDSHVRNNSRKMRFPRLRLTALPTFREAMMPSLCVVSCSSLGVQYCMIKDLHVATLPSDRTLWKSFRLDTRFWVGTPMAPKLQRSAKSNDSRQSSAAFCTTCSEDFASTPSCITSAKPEFTSASYFGRSIRRSHGKVINETNENRFI